jgi:hypothetical protein
MSRFPHFLGSQMAVRLSALRAGCPLPPKIFLVLISVRGWVDPSGILWLEGWSQLKKKIHLIGTRSCDLPDCNMVPQPTKTAGKLKGFQTFNSFPFSLYLFACPIIISLLPPPLSLSLFPLHVKHFLVSSIFFIPSFLSPYSINERR